MVNRVIGPPPELLINLVMELEEVAGDEGVLAYAIRQRLFLDAVLCPQDALFELLTLRFVGFLCRIFRYGRLA